MHIIYLDNNATTPVDPRVIEAMLAELKKGPANPSSIHSYGKAALMRLIKAREDIANYLKVHRDELIFTSSGTEAITLAIQGMQPKGRIISSKIEHASVFNTLTSLPNPITYLPVGIKGHIECLDLEEAIDTDVSLIVLSAVNSETGVKNPIEEIASIAKKHAIPLVIDGVALLGKEVFSIPPGVQAMAFSAHKIHGPQGIGLLFVRKGCILSPLFRGGEQELSRRAGTENLPGIVGFAKAITLLQTELIEGIQRMHRLREMLEKGLKGIKINGTGPRICNTTSLTFPGVDGESLLIQLDQKGIITSIGSACSSGALGPSRVLLEMGLSREEALSTLRFSLSRFTTEKEIQDTLVLLPELLNTLSVL